MSRLWNALACTPALYARLSFDRLTPKRDGRPRGVEDAVLATLCRRAGASLRALDIREKDACRGITPHGLDATLRGVDRSALELRVGEDFTFCWICCNELRNMLFFMCSHTFCADCGAHMRYCPMCVQPPRGEPLRVFF